MYKFLSKFLIDDYEAYEADTFCAMQTGVCIVMLVAGIVLSVIPELLVFPNDIMQRLGDHKRELIFNRLDQETTYVKPLESSTPAKTVKEAPMSVVPLVFATTPTPMTKKDSVVKEEKVEAQPKVAEHKHVPANLKAVPNKPLSAAPANVEVTKGPTYTWRSSGNTVKITYPDGRVEIVSKSLLPYLLGK